jgi:hypothetical protein
MGMFASDNEIQKQFGYLYFSNIGPHFVFQVCPGPPS